MLCEYSAGSGPCGADPVHHVQSAERWGLKARQGGCRFVGGIAKIAGLQAEMRFHMRLSLLPLLLLTPLSACISFGGKAPDQLLSLTAESSLPAGTVRNVAVGAGLVVAVPETPRKIDTYRVAVQVDETSIRSRVVEGKSVTVSVDLGGRRNTK